ncbi:unnamed protein product [Blepharisma stoltei]|uniref:Protein-tyrosine-phosphatase n=1 Tax=Blepharisma stoltei TaxID=1481888 RepID=A0AAU9ITM6_9CILI|nr:unnamed protein product [Blepharisma stoltei]
MTSFLLAMNEIEPGLFLSGIIAANNRDLVMSKGINSIVSVISDATIGNKHPDINYYTIRIDDLPMENITVHIPGAIKFIHQEMTRGKRVLVHCAAGISRSSSIMVAYFMAKYNESFDEALARVRRGRPVAWPNQGFETQLRRLDINFLRSCLTNGLEISVRSS